MPRRAFAYAVALLLQAQCVQAATVLQFWHSMRGSAGEEVRRLAERFNASQHSFLVVPVYKGNYEQTLAAAMATLHTHKAPNIVQIFGAGTAAMIEARGAIKPLYRLMAEAREKFNARDYLPAVASYYSDRRGRLLSLPFNSSTPVLYYNKDVLRKAGVGPQQPLTTWLEVQKVAEEVLDSRAAPCAYTTDWPSWIMAENLSAWHNEPMATHDNGFRGAGAKLDFNSDLLIRHISLMSSWMKSGLFTYAGRETGGEAKFAKGECAMVTASSLAYPRLAKSAHFTLAVSALPFYSDYRGAPFNTTVRGASLWAPAGKRHIEYKGVAKFLSFLARPDVQAEWDTTTGYLPNTLSAYALIRQQGYYKRYPGADIAIVEMNRTPRPYSRGLRLEHLPAIRAVIDDELEAVWHRTKTPIEALNSAVSRGNALLHEFRRRG